MFTSDIIIKIFWQRKYRKKDLVTAAGQIEIYYEIITNNKAKNITYVFHFNQEAPHVHVIFETE